MSLLPMYFFEGSFLPCSKCFVGLQVCDCILISCSLYLVEMLCLVCGGCECVTEFQFCCLLYQRSIRYTITDCYTIYIYCTMIQSYTHLYTVKFLVVCIQASSIFMPPTKISKKIFHCQSCSKTNVCCTCSPAKWWFPHSPLAVLPTVFPMQVIITMEVS